MSLLQSVRSKPPMFTQNTCYSKWRKAFEEYISYNDPDMRIPLIKRYERPVRVGTTTEKPYKSMTPEERKALNDEKKTLAAIQMSLSMEIAKMFRHYNIAYDLWVAIEKRCGGNTKEDEPQPNAFMTQKQEVDSDAFKCSSCIQLTVSNNMYKDDIEKLIEANKMLKDNEKLYEQKLKAIFEEKKEYKAKIFAQQDEIDSYIKMMTKIKKELADSQAEILDLQRKLSNYSTSSLVFDEVLQSQKTYPKRKASLGYHQVPPPKEYHPMPSKDPIKDFVPSSFNVATDSVDSSVNKQDEEAELVKPTCVDSKSTPLVSVEELVEVEDLPEESTIKVEKRNVKPENFIITTEYDERYKCKGKAKVDDEFFNVKNKTDLKKDKLVDKIEKNKCLTSTSSTLGTSTSTCCPSTACSTNVPVHRPSVYIPPPKRFEGTHWNNTFVERRSCFRCGQQGHIIRDCRLLSLDRFGREMPRTSSFRNSFSQSFSRRSSYSPVSSCASNSPKPMARVNKVVPSRPQVQKHNIVENKSSKPKQVWIPKSTNNTSMNSAEFLKYHKLIDAVIMDAFGQPKSVKAWVSHKI